MKNIPPQQLRSSSSPHGESEVTHMPVLLEDTVRLLAPRANETYLDLTAGYGGHASKIIEAIGPANATLVDRDQTAIAHLHRYGEQGARLIHRDFASAAQQLVEHGETFSMLLVDLGVSSPQIDTAERGFSIQHDGPLDMRMDHRSERTAAEIVNRMSEKELARIIETYGEESRVMAARIAHAIRLNRPLHTTSQLANVVSRTYSYHRGVWKKIHPATRTFQAIRIELNDELTQVSTLMPLIPRLLQHGGRAVVISFHSLEDRIVKRYFAEQTHAGYEAELRLLIKKPILGATHDDHNPRARSATLRAVVKI